MSERREVGQDYIRGEASDAHTATVGKNIDQHTVNVGFQHPADDKLTRADLYHEMRRMTEELYLLSGDVRVIREQMAIIQWLRWQVIILGLSIIVLAFALIIAWFGMNGEIADIQRKVEFLMRDWNLP